MPMKLLKDRECTADTPVSILGEPQKPIYGTGKRIRPHIEGRCSTPHDKKVYLPELLPLEAYDLIIVLLSGGKDSTAAFWSLIELGVPIEKIEIWNQNIDGSHPYRRMDWPVTAAYVRSFAEAVGAPLRPSWRVNGFFGELYRIGASYVGDTQSCVVHTDTKALWQTKTGIFTKEDVFVPAGIWKYPAGAFLGSDGGPC